MRDTPDTLSFAVASWRMTSWGRASTGGRADVSCDNGAGDVVSLGVWRERAQFGTTLQFNTSSLTREQTISVPPYFGINCRRVRASMAVSHGNTIIWMSQSGGECF